MDIKTDETGSSCWKRKNGNVYRLAIVPRLLVLNFKFLCHLVRPTDTFKTNKGYIAKQKKIQKKAKIRHKEVKNKNFEKPKKKIILQVIIT